MSSIKRENSIVGEVYASVNVAVAKSNPAA